MATGEAALARLTDPAAEVSCHYLVWEDGRIDQLVAEADRAWHAGRSCWAGETDLNSVSLGIELVNGGHEHGLPAFPDAQIDRLVALCRDLCGRRGIARSRVLAHSDIAPERKMDPGERFPWRRLSRQGVALAPRGRRSPAAAAGSNEADEAAALLARIGYDLGPVGGAGLPAAIRAFQRRWRPRRVDGVCDAQTLARLRSVEAARGQDD